MFSNIQNKSNENKIKKEEPNEKKEQNKKINNNKKLEEKNKKEISNNNNIKFEEKIKNTKEINNNTINPHFEGKNKKNKDLINTNNNNNNTNPNTSFFEEKMKKNKEIKQVNNKEKNNIIPLANKRNSINYELNSGKKVFNELIEKFSNKIPSIKPINKEKEKSKEIVINPLLENIESKPIKISNSPKNKKVKILTNIEKVEDNNNISKNINNNEDSRETKNEKKQSSVKRSKSSVKTKKSNNINSKVETEFLDIIPINSELKTNSFCKAFFVASFPKKNNKLIEDSEGLTADCGHEECSQLPAFQPEIVYKYPEKDSNDLEINNILASICFPHGIKVCYFNIEDKIYTLKNYRSCFTNQVGDRFYSMMYHFYVRMKNYDFYKKYNTALFEKIVMKYSGKIGATFEDDTELINKINSKEFVFVPYCICLISKYPFFHQMEKCLESIMETLKHSNIEKNELNEIITYLVKTIPSPYVNTSIFFPVPNCSDIIELKPCFYQELPLYGNNPISLLDKLKVNNIYYLFKLLLFEQKILLISNDYDNLSEVSLNLISLLYPFNWVHIYIPIVTEKMLKYLQSFLPFFNGMHSSLYEKEEVKRLLYNSHKDLFIFDIDKNKLEISSNLFTKKRVNPEKFLNKQLPPFPKNIEEIIIPQINILKSYYKSHSEEDNNYLSDNIKAKLLFIQIFMELFYDYKKYLATIDDLPVFNTNAFLNKRPENDKVFYKELTTTQLYQIFIQNSLSYINNKKKSFFFDELIEEYIKKKEKAKEENIKNKKKLPYYIIVHNEFECSINNQFFTITKNYGIKPSHLKLFQPFEGKLKHQKGSKLLHDINFYLKKEFKERHFLNEKGVIKENRRIVHNDLNLLHQNDIKTFGYYLTPEEEEENEEKENEKKAKNIKMTSIEEESNISNIQNKKNENPKKDNKDLKEDSSDNENLTEIEKEDIRDNIKETLTRVFKCEKVNVTKDSAVLLSSIVKQYGRDYFVDIIEQNRNSKEVKIISGDSFTILLEVISKSLLKLPVNTKNIIYALKLIKSCLFFKAIVNKIDYLLYDKMIEILTKNFKLYNEILFWDLWIEDDLNERDVEILNEFKQYNQDSTYHYIDEEDDEIITFKENYKKVLKNARNNMIKMKLNKSFMLSVIEGLCDKYFKDDEDFKYQQVIEIMNRK